MGPVDRFPDDIVAEMAQKIGTVVRDRKNRNVDPVTGGLLLQIIIKSYTLEELGCARAFAGMLHLTLTQAIKEVLDGE